jgi:hypothetical protein
LPRFSDLKTEAKKIEEEIFGNMSDKTITSTVEYDDGSKGVTYSDGTSEIIPASEEKEASVTNQRSEEISYLLGNKFNPVVILGDDPSNAVENEDGTKNDNVLVAHFSRVESVPRENVYAEETAPKDSK